MLFTFQRKQLCRSLVIVVLVGCGMFSLAYPKISLATVRRNDISDNVVLQLARQQQFSGAGTVNNGGGSGVAIAPGWVLTVAHVAQTSNTSSFRLDGQTYFGTPILHPEADLALIRLNNNSQLPASTAFISPNSNFNPVSNLVWKSGSGRHGTRRDANNGNLGASGGAQRAGTNIVNNRAPQNVGVGIGPTDLLAYLRPNTPFDVTTAPGDSGGPMFLQVNNQWVVSGVTVGVVPGPGLGFVDTDIASYHGWIEQQTGLTFQPSAGPTELFFDADFTTAGVQSDAISEFTPVWDNSRPFFTGGTEGYNYTWENDFAPTAVFGTANSGARSVRVDNAITYGGLRFDPTSASSTGTFQLSNGTGSLRAGSGGATIEVNQDASILASLVGSANEGITKTGNADLLLGGNNQAYNATIAVNEGTLTVGLQNALGAGGSSALTRTIVNSGGTLHLSGANITLNERLELHGQGANDEGALKVSSGHHTLTQTIAVGTDATINVAENAGVTIGDVLINAGLQNGQLSQKGGGTVVYEELSQMVALDIAEGVAAGNGGTSGSVSIGSAGELRPGDAFSGSALGSFQAGDFSLENGGALTFDINPQLDLSDVILVDGLLDLAGDLNINFLDAPEFGEEFLLIDVNGEASVEGQFANITIDNSTFLNDEFLFVVDYAGGTGNDVVLTAISAIPEPSSILLVAMLAGLANLGRSRR